MLVVISLVEVGPGLDRLTKMEQVWGKLQPATLSSAPGCRALEVCQVLSALTIAMMILCLLKVLLVTLELEPGMAGVSPLPGRMFHSPRHLWGS